MKRLLLTLLFLIQTPLWAIEGKWVGIDSSDKPMLMKVEGEQLTVGRKKLELVREGHNKYSAEHKLMGSLYGDRDYLRRYQLKWVQHMNLLVVKLEVFIVCRSFGPTCSNGLEKTVTAHLDPAKDLKLSDYTMSYFYVDPMTVDCSNKLLYLVYTSEDEMADYGTNVLGERERLQKERVAEVYQKTNPPKFLFHQTGVHRFSFYGKVLELHSVDHHFLLKCTTSQE